MPLPCLPLQVGNAPKEDALNVFLMRLREQGWDVSPMLAMLKRNGAQLASHVRGRRGGGCVSCAMGGGGGLCVCAVCGGE